jgi:hypothetical protein
MEDELKQVPEPLTLPLAPEVDVTAETPGPLWQGPVHLRNPDGAEFEGLGSLTYEWTSEPFLVLHVSSNDSFAKPVFTGYEISVEGRPLDGWQATGLHPEGGTVVRTFNGTDIILGDRSAPCQAVRFVYVNFPRFVGLPVRNIGCSGFLGFRAGRLELDTEDWQFRLDEAESGNPYERLGQGQRFAITHVGLLTSKTKTTINLEGAESALISLSTLASILRGAGTAPMTWTGEGRGGEVLWTRHTVWQLDQWGGLPGPLSGEASFLMADPKTIPALNRSLARLLELREDDLWREVLDRAVLWLITANTGKTPGDVILAQAGLELMAYATVVLGEALPVEAFVKLDASHQIHLMLSLLKIPLAVPPSLKRLCAFAASNQNASAPAVVTRFRNRITHPPKRGASEPRDNYWRTTYEAKILATHLLERCLLATLGYDGPMHDGTSAPP